MDAVILNMLAKYKCENQEDYENALKEIIQEVALLGLWRAKFFEHALFYGGTALRILFGLNRFSEDLDFSLITEKPDFKFEPYLKAIEDELQSFGFKTEVTSKIKSHQTQIESAFIKAGTRFHFLKAQVPPEIQKHIQSSDLLKIKLELDTNPPLGFTTEMKALYQPIPFYVKTMSLEDLFAGKLHAILVRGWKQRVKGRDFYDYLWYLGRGVSCHLEHLKQRLVQTGHWSSEKVFKHQDLINLLKERFQNVNFEEARKDVTPFLKPRERASLDIWSQHFFQESLTQLTAK